MIVPAQNLQTFWNGTNKSMLKVSKGKLCFMNDDTNVEFPISMEGEVCVITRETLKSLVDDAMLNHFRSA